MPIDVPQDLLVLDSRLDEVSRAQSWAETFADRLRLSESTRYAIQLCLEEALANVILHGYEQKAGHPIVLRSWQSSGKLFFAVEDKAPPFTPEDLPPPADTGARPSLESLTPGGNGLRLLRHFADSLAYERFPEGNRLRISFLIG